MDKNEFRGSLLYLVGLCNFFFEPNIGLNLAQKPANFSAGILQKKQKNPLNANVTRQLNQ